MNKLTRETKLLIEECQDGQVYVTRDFLVRAHRALEGYEIVCDRYFAVAQALGKDEATPDLADLVAKLKDDNLTLVHNEGFLVDTIRIGADTLTEWQERAIAAEDEAKRLRKVLDNIATGLEGRPVQMAREALANG